MESNQYIFQSQLQPHKREGRATCKILTCFLVLSHAGEDLEPSFGSNKYFGVFIANECTKIFQFIAEVLHSKFLLSKKVYLFAKSLS